MDYTRSDSTLITTLNIIWKVVLGFKCSLFYDGVDNLVLHIESIVGFVFFDSEKAFAQALSLKVLRFNHLVNKELKTKEVTCSRSFLGGTTLAF